MQRIKSIKVGVVSNPIKPSFKSELHLKKVEVLFPARLNAMALDPSKISLNKNQIYTPGEIVFSIKIFTRAKVEAIDKKGEIIISEKTKRKSLVRHAALLMKEAIGFKESLFIEAVNEHNMVHAGLGSSGGLIASVAAAINMLYGSPIPREKLVKYLAQNHGEEIEGDDGQLVPVQCIGGSAASGLCKGGVIVLAGESQIIKTANIDGSYSVIIGVPKDYNSPDAKEALEEELKSIKGFIECGKKYGLEIAYNMLHSFLPAMNCGKLNTMGDIIFDYRYNMGSIKNCSFLYKKLPELMDKLAFLKEENIAEVLAISSVGPGVFAISKNTKKCKSVFEKEGLKTFETRIENGDFIVVSQNKCDKKLRGK